MKQLALLLVLLLSLPAARAQTRRLVSTAADAGPGSLREALTAATTGDSILFGAALARQTIRLSTHLTLNKSVIIDGRRATGLTLSGENRVPILRIDYSFISVEIHNLTFANGRAVDADAGTQLRGGAIELLDPNTLRLENCRFLRNAAERGGALFVGYGARATVLNCLFQDNDGTAAGDGFSAGAISTFGGGAGAQVLENGVGGAAFLDVRGCTVRRNKVIGGGGIYVLLGGLRVEDCQFHSNEAQAGGAVFQDGCNGTEREDALGGTTIIRRCVVDSSLVRGQGGGFYLWGYSRDTYIIENTTVAHNKVVPGGQFNESKGGAIQVRDRASLQLRNCTLADNEVTQQGGALWLDCRGPEGITIENCTFSGNRARSSTGGGDIGGAGVFNSAASTAVRVTNCTLFGNSADRADGCFWIAGDANAQNLTFTNCVFAGNRAGTNGSAREQSINFPARSGGGNFIQNAGGAVTSGLPTATYLADLRLTPALTEQASTDGRSYGVHPPLPASPLLDAGVAVAGLSTDQLGTSRPLDGNFDGVAGPDPGAVEFVTRGPLTLPTRVPAQRPVPAGLTLAPPFPNPAAGLVTLSYTLPQAGPVRLRLLDMTGRPVAVLAGGPQRMGPHELQLSAAAWRLRAGLYVLELEAGPGRVRQRLAVE